MGKGTRQGKSREKGKVWIPQTGKYLSRFLMFMYSRLGAMEENGFISGSKLRDSKLNRCDRDHVVRHYSQ